MALSSGIEALLARLLPVRGRPAGRPAPVQAELGADGEAIRLRELAAALERFRSRFTASRAVLWRVDSAAGHAFPIAFAGPESPGQVALAGEPLGWAAAEGLPLRLDLPPAWAHAAAEVRVQPLPADVAADAVLTIELGAHGIPLESELLRDAAAAVATLLRLHERERRAERSAARLGEVLDALRRLPQELEPAAFGLELADVGCRLSGATGAAVASWEQESGRVLAVTGQPEGPAVGQLFAPSESEMALAARGAAPILRTRRDGRSLPVASSAERWASPPRSLAVVPLRGTDRETVGVLALWRGEGGGFDPGDLAILEILGPYAALQLRHALSYGSLRDRAEIDGLTGLHNRRAFDERLLAEAARYERYHRPLSLILLDLDHFKQINDSHGHAAGDAVLRATGSLLRSLVRETDLAARFGGEEFAILVPETGLEAAVEAAGRIRAALASREVVWQGRPIPITASLGVSACPACVASPADLIGAADAALYASKQGGRNRVSVGPAK